MAVRAAEMAGPGWRRTPAPKRAEIMFRFAALLAGHKERLARAMTREMGKVLTEARGDVQEGIDLAFLMAGEGRRMFGDTFTEWKAISGGDHVFHRFLGIEPTRRPSAPIEPGDTETVRRIVARLEALPPERARLLASFAYIVARAANADLRITEVETAAMERVLVDGGLDEAQAVLVVEMAKLQALVSGATEDFLVTREFREISTPEQRRALLHACYVVGAADDEITGAEVVVLGQIASELGLEREDVAPIRAEFAETLTALRIARRSAGRAERGPEGEGGSRSG